MTLQEKLADAEHKYHLLLTGQSAREYVDQNGERVTYVAANRQDLLTYIRSLKSQIASSQSGGGQTFSRPLTVRF